MTPYLSVQGPLVLSVEILRMTFGHYRLALPSGFRAGLIAAGWPADRRCDTNPPAAHVLEESCNHD